MSKQFKNPIEKWQKGAKSNKNTYTIPLTFMALQCVFKIFE